MKDQALRSILFCLTILLFACTKPATSPSDMLRCESSGTKVYVNAYVFCVYEFKASADGSLIPSLNQAESEDNTGLGATIGTGDAIGSAELAIEEDQTVNAVAPSDDFDFAVLPAMDQSTKPSPFPDQDMDTTVSGFPNNFIDMSLPSNRLDQGLPIDISNSDLISSLCVTPLSYTNLEASGNTIVIICSAFDQAPKALLDLAYQEAKRLKGNAVDLGIEIGLDLGMARSK